MRDTAESEREGIASISTYAGGLEQLKSSDFWSWERRSAIGVIMPTMDNIRRPTAPSHLLDQLQNWFEVEWGNVDPMHAKGAPAPLVVTDDQGRLLGGLAFTISPKPASTEPGVWINALVVSPAYRRRGIASLLVEAAELEAWHQDTPELYVYTDVPALYSSNGWTELARNGDNSTLTKARPA